MVGEIRERIFVIVSFWTIHNTTNYNYLFILTFIEANSNLNQGVYNERVFKPYSQDISIRARIKSLSGNTKAFPGLFNHFTDIVLTSFLVQYLSKKSL